MSMKLPQQLITKFDRGDIEALAHALPVQRYIGEFPLYRRIDILAPAIVLLTVTPGESTSIHISADYSYFADAIELEGSSHALVIKPRLKSKINSSMWVDADEGFKHEVSMPPGMHLATANRFMRLMSRLFGIRPPRGALVLKITAPKVPDIIQHANALVLVDGVDQYSVCTQVYGGTLCLRGQVENLACFAAGEATSVLASDLQAQSGDPISAVQGAHIRANVRDQFRGLARDKNSLVTVQGNPPMTSVEMKDGGRVEHNDAGPSSSTSVPCGIPQTSCA
ncbi:hypothetical protein [Hydrogenophaga sp. NFH-34]|uniref:hypothetical protein n=1 Tax=Hydrogenophaga sp. NFH-34 TaxID=2744446 RepID=UPI001F347722|nr:hypothetical protein [Hydrogenophaga sp. NFH-34]